MKLQRYLLALFTGAVPSLAYAEKASDHIQMSIVEGGHSVSARGSCTPGYQYSPSDSQSMSATFRAYLSGQNSWAYMECTEENAEECGGHVAYTTLHYDWKPTLAGTGTLAGRASTSVNGGDSPDIDYHMGEPKETASILGTFYQPGYVQTRTVFSTENDNPGIIIDNSGGMPSQIYRAQSMNFGRAFDPDNYNYRSRALPVTLFNAEDGIVEVTFDLSASFSCDSAQYGYYTVTAGITNVWLEVVYNEL